MRSSQSTRMLWLLAALGLAAPTGCATTKGAFVWADEYQDPTPPEAASGYVIAPGDLIWVRIFNQEGMSAKGRVRADGKFSVPFLNDVVVAGYTPDALAQQLQTRLKDFVNAAQVTVSLEEQRPLTVSILGEVARPGLITVEPGAGMLTVLAAAGGLTEYGHKDRVFLLRKTGSAPQPTRIRFDLTELYRGEGNGAQLRLRSGDVVVVE